MSNTYVILGNQFGDEAKGKLVDYLVDKAGENAVVFRFNGGCNAGHTIKVGETKFYSHLFPSGCFSGKTKNYLGPGVVVNLKALFDEYEDHTSKGLDLTNKFFISELAHITFNCHVEIDKRMNSSIGTTNKGIGPTYSDIASRKGMRFDQLLQENWKEQLKDLYNYHNICLDYVELDYIEGKLEQIKKWVIPQYVIENEFNNENNVIFIEGANALMLDTYHGTYPYVTSSHCSLSGVFTGLGISPKYMKTRKWEIIGVAKCYITRVGGGVLPTEDKTEIGSEIQRIGGEIGVTTGRKRRCGWLDLPQLKYANNINGTDYLNITKLDVLSFLDEIKVCTKYNTEIYPSNENKLSKVVPEYVSLPGWKGFNISKCETWDELHPNIKSFIKFIESETGIKVKYINSGPERNQMIIL
jgi:adenylosuccinate synthase